MMRRRQRPTMTPPSSARLLFATVASLGTTLVVMATVAAAAAAAAPLPRRTADSDVAQMLRYLRIQQPSTRDVVVPNTLLRRRLDQIDDYLAKAEETMESENKNLDWVNLEGGDGTDDYQGDDDKLEKFVLAELKGGHADDDEVEELLNTVDDDQMEEQIEKEMQVLEEMMEGNNDGDGMAPHMEDDGVEPDIAMDTAEDLGLVDDVVGNESGGDGADGGADTTSHTDQQDDLATEEDLDALSTDDGSGTDGIDGSATPIDTDDGTDVVVETSEDAPTPVIPPPGDAQKHEHEEQQPSAPKSTDNDDAGSPSDFTDETAIPVRQQLLQDNLGDLAADPNLARLIVIAGVVAIVLMVFTAWQMADNPDGIFAALCRLVLSALGLVFKIIMLPFGKCCGCCCCWQQPRRPYGHIPTMEYGSANGYGKDVVSLELH